LLQPGRASSSVLTILCVSSSTLLDCEREGNKAGFEKTGADDIMQITPTSNSGPYGCEAEVLLWAEMISNKEMHAILSPLGTDKLTTDMTICYRSRQIWPQSRYKSTIETANFMQA